MAVTILHLSRHEFYRMNPGLYYDMVQIYSDRLPKKPGEDID